MQFQQLHQNIAMHINSKPKRYTNDDCALFEIVFSDTGVGLRICDKVNTEWFIPPNIAQYLWKDRAQSPDTIHINWQPFQFNLSPFDTRTWWHSGFLLSGASDLRYNGRKICMRLRLSRNIAGIEIPSILIVIPIFPNLVARYMKLCPLERYPK